MIESILKTIQKDFLKYMKAESLSRVEKCFSFLSEEDVWLRPNKSSNSMANIVIHLNGNIRQYIISGLGNTKDTRNRTMEFSIREGFSKAELLHVFEATIEEACKVVMDLKSEQLIKTYEIQGFDMTGISVLLHVIEHCSYHVGQITYFTKMIKDIDTGYYSDLDLNVKNG